MSDDPTLDPGIDLAEILPNSPQIPPNEQETERLLISIRDLITQFVARRSARADHIDSQTGRPIWGPCTRCGYVWMGRADAGLPKHCARCHSVAWQNIPKQQGGRKGRSKYYNKTKIARPEPPVAAAGFPVAAYFFPPLGTVQTGQWSPANAAGQGMPLPPPPVIVMPSPPVHI